MEVISILMTRMIILLSLVFSLAGFFPLQAQHGDSHHGKDQSGSSRHTPVSHRSKGMCEIIVSSIYSYSLSHEPGQEPHEIPGMEVHVSYWFNQTWGTGSAYCVHFEEHEQVHDIALLLNVNPMPWLTLNVGPNLSLPNHHRHVALGLYSEAEFNIRPSHWFHFGPNIGTVLNEHSEFSAGMHVGVEF